MKIEGEQFVIPFIEHEVRGENIPQRQIDGYVNATALCKVAGKRLGHYFDNRNTQAFLQVLSSKTGIPVNELIDARKGGNVRLSGTWVHPHVAVNLGQWLSPEFAVQVAIWVTEWMSKGGRTERLPYHLRRYMDNQEKIPVTHFSMLGEMSVSLFGPLERNGYVPLKSMIPDSSSGRMFCKFLRDEMGINTDSLLTYSHRYEDGREFPAKLYPIEILGAFRKYLLEVWFPEKSVKYFKDRDINALPALSKVLQSYGLLEAAREALALPSPGQNNYRW